MDGATRGLLARALAVLREVEWEGVDVLYKASAYSLCPVCEGIRPRHADDCELKRTIDDLERAIGEGGTGER